MANESEVEEQSSEVAVNTYRVAQLEKQLEKLEAGTATLNLEQIKQMGIWLGLPVAIATGVFGLALWQTIETGTISAAERRASETVRALTGEIATLQTRIKDLQTSSEETYAGVREIWARADESAKAVRRQANNAEARANDAARALAELQRTAASASDIQQALGDVEKIASQITGNSEFQKIVSETTLTGLAGLIAAFDQGEGCPKGWSEFEPAAGRMIIGTGQGSIDRNGDQDIPLTERRWRESGGSENHTLTDEEMPPHGHSTGMVSIPAPPGGVTSMNSSEGRLNLPWLREGSDSVVEGGHDLVIHKNGGKNGKTEPHNNMPPYIALYFCRKN